MFRERIFITGILAAVFMVVLGLFAPESPDPEENVQSAKTDFFIKKAHNQQKYDMVIVGDSRALRGLSPTAMEEELTNRQVYNLAFHAGGLNDEIFTLAESLLKPEAPERAILLAPTSLAFLPHKKGNAQYREYKEKPRDLLWLYMNHPEWARFFQKLSPSVYFRSWFNIEPKEMLFQEFHQNGWIATDQTPHDDVTDLSKPRNILMNRHLDVGLIVSFMEQTKQWTQSGIQVFGLIPPAYGPRVAFEDSTLGFDQVAFVNLFREAGGIWLETSNENLTTYDGSHLVKESSLALSRETGRQIAQVWP